MFSHFRPRHAYGARPNTVISPYTKLATVLGAEIMWGVAAYADRVNGGYVKEVEYDSQGKKSRERNRDLIKQQIQAGLPDMTEADLELGREARKWHQGNIMFKTLRGQHLSDFEKHLQIAVNQEEFSNRDDGLLFAIVASQISSYRKGRELDQLMESLDRSELAPVGDKVAVEATVVRSVFSHKYGVAFVTARTQCNRLVFFSFRETIPTGTPIRIRGTVKAHGPDSTRLNRVRLL